MTMQTSLEEQVPEILKNLPARIGDIVKPWAARLPDHPALVEASGVWTYAQLEAAIARAQSWLEDLGIRPGDRVMLVCENCRAFVAILLAITNLDAWPVLVSARLSAREIDQIREHCSARRVIYTTGVSPQAAQHARRHGASIAEAATLGMVGMSALNEEAAPEPIEADAANRVAALIYTSGTTGLPKGIMLSHRNLLYLAAVSAKIRSLTAQDRMYGILPMSHAVGFSVVLLGTLLSGATLYLSPRFDPVAALAAIERDRLTVVLGVPAMFSLLLEYAKSKNFASLRFPALRIIASSGAPLHSAVKAGVESLFGLPLYNGYGVTECSPTIAQVRVETPRADTSVGRIFPGVEVKLVGADGKTVADGEVGELRVRGPNIMKGYYHAPEETAAAIDSEGWFNTRDLARLDGENLFIVGRTKELIVRFGFNVYAAEVEAVLNAHPGVERSAVVGRAGESMNGDEEVVAYIQLLPDVMATAADLTEHAARHLAPYKRPSEIIFVSSMPLTPTGKVMKAELVKLNSASVPGR